MEGVFAVLLDPAVAVAVLAATSRCRVLSDVVGEVGWVVFVRMERRDGSFSLVVEEDIVEREVSKR
jgi:hypothetical protein